MDEAVNKAFRSPSHPIPAGYHPERQLRRSAIIVGVSAFGGAYGLSVLTAAGATDVPPLHFEWLYVPFLGPFVVASEFDAIPSVSDLDKTLKTIFVVTFVCDGIAQVVGAAFLTFGLTNPKTVLVRDPVSPPRARLTPLSFGRTGVGIGVVGAF
jgi:hypothetical protein